MNVTTATQVVMVGVGGTGMRGLAYLLHEQGKKIIGADVNAAAFIHSADLTFVDWLVSDTLPRKAELLIYSDAVPGDHELRAQGRARGLAELPYHTAVAELAERYRLIAVAGTHGKSTTTAMLGHILIENGLDPTVLLGAPVPAWGNRGARIGQSDLFILEADEYRDHFRSYWPAGAVVVSLDFDHPDYFASFEAVQKSFDRFLTQIQPGGWAVTTAEVAARYSRLSWPEQTITPTGAPPASARLHGDHMRSNAQLALEAAVQLGVERETAIAALATVPALGRRLETLGSWHELTIVSDYGHHPTEIAATLAAAREIFPSNKILTILEVHTPERLREFSSAFANALQSSDGVLLAPAFLPIGRSDAAAQAARDLARLEQLLQRKGRSVQRIQYEQLPVSLTEAARTFDVAIAFSAGALDGHLRRLVNTA